MTSVNQRIKVPKNYDSVSLEDLLPKEGERVVRVESVEQNFDSGVVRVRFMVLDGEDRGLTFTVRYDLSLDFLLLDFRQLMEAAGVRNVDGELDGDPVGQELAVRITHSRSKSTGRVFVKIQDPRPNF